MFIVTRKPPLCFDGDREAAKTYFIGGEPGAPVFCDRREWAPHYQIVDPALGIVCDLLDTWGSGLGAIGVEEV
jgi:hypothetical protein